MPISQMSKPSLSLWDTPGTGGGGGVGSEPAVNRIGLWLGSQHPSGWRGSGADEGLHFADKLQGLHTKEDLGGGLYRASCKCASAVLFCTGAGSSRAHTPDLPRPPPPTRPAELARKWEEQVTGARIG